MSSPCADVASSARVQNTSRTLFILSRLAHRILGSKPHVASRFTCSWLRTGAGVTHRVNPSASVVHHSSAGPISRCYPKSQSRNRFSQHAPGPGKQHPRKRIGRSQSCDQFTKPENINSDRPPLLTAPREEQAERTQHQQNDRTWFRNRHGHGSKQIIIPWIANLPHQAGKPSGQINSI
jgi:hypothetical protein